ncbi:MAG TPA: tail fiber domain-containing protein, partial [Aquaticitalea sp.]|nr:tail fiber domain-containing protein [Aquaticitalea sp.]
DHFVFGSTSLDNIAGINDDRRMFFNKAKAAFRAGLATGTQWDDINVGNRSVSFGYNNTASGANSAAFGVTTTASGLSSAAFGYNTTASEGYSVAFGYSTTASGVGSVAFGELTTASGNNSVAFGGFGTTASGYFSAAFGHETTAEGANSAAFGVTTIASGTNSAAFGGGTTASGLSSIAFGTNNIAEGNYSAAFGQNTTASGSHSIATGFNTTTSGVGSVVFGSNNTSASIYETVFGRFATLAAGSPTSWMVNDRLFAIGNGSGNASRSNALTILKNGRMGLQSVTNPTYALQLPNSSTNGIGQAQANAWNTYSDGRLKTNRAMLPYGLKEIMRLEPLAYFHHNSEINNGILTIQEEGKEQIGFIAQDMYQIIPEIVGVPEDETKELWGISYDKLTPVLVKAVQELKAENDELKVRLERLEKLLLEKE